MTLWVRLAPVEGAGNLATGHRRPPSTPKVKAMTTGVAANPSAVPVCDSP